MSKKSGILGEVIIGVVATTLANDTDLNLSGFWINSQLWQNGQRKLQSGRKIVDTIFPSQSRNEEAVNPLITISFIDYSPA